MKKIILIAFTALSASSAFATAKSADDCFKVEEIRFERDGYVTISGMNPDKNRAVSYGTSAKPSKEVYRENIESAKFAMANDLQVCAADNTFLLSIRK